MLRDFVHLAPAEGVELPLGQVVPEGGARLGAAHVGEFQKGAEHAVDLGQPERRRRRGGRGSLLLPEMEKV